MVCAIGEVEIKCANISEEGKLLLSLKNQEGIHEGNGSRAEPSGVVRI